MSDLKLYSPISPDIFSFNLDFHKGIEIIVTRYFFNCLVNNLLLFHGACMPFCLLHIGFVCGFETIKTPISLLFICKW